MKKLSFILLCTFWVLPLRALEPQNPVSLCERFVEGEDRNQCETRMKKLQPDWYLATVCNSSLDDKIFYQCVELTKAGQFSPDKLDICTGDLLTDQDRIECVKSAMTSKAFQSTKTEPKSKKKSLPAKNNKK